MTNNRDTSRAPGSDATGDLEATTKAQGRPSSEEWLVGGGQMAQTIKAMSWAGNPLGPIASWPQSLRTTVSLVQASNSPISLVWGPGHVQIYNDGYWPLCGDKHPTAMGQDFRECWASAFPVIGEAYAKAWSGQSAYLEKIRMFLDRYGFLEETWFTFSFSPITDESGGVGGLFHPVTEMTTQTLSERRGKMLRELARRAGKAKTIGEAFALSAQMLAESDLDVPFFLIYLLDVNGTGARLVGQHGLEPGSLVNPEQLDLQAAGETPWLVAEVARTGLAHQIGDVDTLLAGRTVGPYPELPKIALALPILQPGREKPAAVLVAGVSSRLAMTQAYRGFFDLVAASVGAALANADAHESARRSAGALQSAIFNSANFSSIATDANGVIQIFNVGAERMLGYTAAEVTNTITPADISDPQEVVARARELSIELGTPISPGFEALVFKASRGIEDIYELTYIRKDGSRFPAVVSVTALRDVREAIIGYLLIGIDNTARKHSEGERQKLDQRLRDQHFYTRSLIESNVDALMATDPRGIITDVNRQTEALTGCTREELIGAPFKNCFTDPDRAEAGINRVLNEGRVTNYELTARARDGGLTVVSYNASTFHDRDRVLQGVFAAMRDVTALKRFETTLQEKNVELEKASRLKSEFLANMSHELRTPLNAIIGFSEVLRDGLIGEMTEQQRGFVGDIFSSGKHLLSLINDILDLSKVEAGKMLLVLEPVLTWALFANSLSIVKEKAAARHIRLSVDADETLGSIQADPRKVKQIVYNLLSNAVKFTIEGGEVTLRASRVPRVEVGRLAGSWSGWSAPLPDSSFADFLQISVTDTGIGISPDGMSLLFKPFTQIDSGLARKYEGTGLGLAMVKLLAELHGGTVAVQSVVGEGSRFTVWLPLRALEDESSTVAAAPAVPGLPTPPGARTALVVEDDFQAAELIRVQLEAEGFRVVHAASAEAGLVVAMQQPLSLITLDLQLPHMDGWEFLGRLKQVPDLRRIPVVIISMAADVRQGFALGAAAVMQKPITRQELYESLVELGLFPLAQGEALKVLAVDDDPKAVELIAGRMKGLATSVTRAYGGRDAIAAARRELPDLIVLDLMMPEVNGFDVVEALQEQPDTARIPVLVVTAKLITAEDRTKLNGYVMAVMEKAAFDPDRFTAEVRRAMSGRLAA